MRRILQSILSNKRRRIAFFCILLALIIVGAVGVYYLFKKTPPPPPKIVDYYTDNFCDDNSTQLSAANSIGVMSMQTDADYNREIEAGNLVKISDTDDYFLSDVTYPYVVPKAAVLLDSIGARYRRNIGSGGQKLKVTSASRTEKYQRRLQRGNANATNNSCHTRGATLDISYKPLSEKEKHALGEALRTLRAEGMCYVKYEKRQPCFHFTAR